MADSEKILILLEQGLSAYGLGNVDEALRVWQSVSAMDPGNTKAKEYIRFVEENWGPRQERQEGLGEPYRPDEGSGEIHKPDVVEPGPTLASLEAQGELSEEIDISVEVPLDNLGGFEKGAFTPPVKPILAEDQWDDLYDLGKGQPIAAEEQTAPQPAAPEHPLEDEPVSAPRAISKPEFTPVQKRIEPLDGDWSNVLMPETSSASTLPPHPGNVEVIDIVEAVRGCNPVQEPTEAAPAEAAPVEPESQAGDSIEMTPLLGSPILQPEGSDLLDLVAGDGGSTAEAPAVPGIVAVSEVDSLLKGARDMLELDDFSGAMELLDLVLEQEPEHPQAKKLRGEAEQELLSMLSSKLGDVNRTPRVCMSPDEIIWLNLDNRAGFVLSLVDGSLSLDEIVSICGLSQLESTRILVQLFHEKVIEIN
jgi:hypothetical protein